jgi:hypothetical protein
MNNDLEHLRRTAKRLERYACRVREKVWSGDREDLVTALADTAEAGEIARRLCLQIQISLQPVASPPPPTSPHTPRQPHRLQDEPLSCFIRDLFQAQPLVGHPGALHNDIQIHSWPRRDRSSLATVSS